LPRPVRTAAEKKAAKEATQARLLALAMDYCNKNSMHKGIEPEALRAEYPDGYDPGQLLTGPDRAKVAAYVDSFVDVEAAS